MTTPQPLVHLDGITLRFGGLLAANKISLSVERGTIAAVIGPNGAGKTTLFNCVSGIYTPNSGTMCLAGVELRTPLTAGVLARTALFGLAFGAVVSVAVRAQELWSATITDRFIYGEPFDWSGAAAAFLSTISAPTALPTTVATFLLSALLCSCAALTSWQRTRHTPVTAVRRKIARTFQNIRLFRSMTVLENVLVGMHSIAPIHPLATILRTRRFRAQEAQQQQRARELLDFVGLAGLEDTAATTLSYGHQRRLEIARALASQPHLLLLDEPAAGMNLVEIEDLKKLIVNIRARGVTVVLIEHHMQLVMGVSDQVTVLEYGRTLAHGTPAEIKRDPRVIAAYLGEPHAEQ